VVLLAFCEHYHLTARERVILKEVLQGKDSQNIASSLQLAMGTVKAHTTVGGRSRRGRPPSRTGP